MTKDLDRSNESRGKDPQDATARRPPTPSGAPYVMDAGWAGLLADLSGSTATEATPIRSLRLEQ